MRTIVYKFLILSILFVVGTQALALNTVIVTKNLLTVDDWLKIQLPIAHERLFKNINPSGTASGVVVASPQTENPNYFRHWTRDAALVMDVVFQKQQKATTYQELKYLNNSILQYMYFSIENQGRASLGEPIFDVSGQPFVGPWGRPQNDGPALRAIVFTKWALTLIKQGKTDFVKKYLYNGEWPANTLIKRDLEYVASEWNNPCFDLWEEVKAKHFYTQMVQRRALYHFVSFSRRLKSLGPTISGAMHVFPTSIQQSRTVSLLLASTTKRMLRGIRSMRSTAVPKQFSPSSFCHPASHSASCQMCATLMLACARRSLASQVKRCLLSLSSVRTERQQPHCWWPRC